MEEQIYPISIIGKNSLVSVTLSLKVFVSRIESCAFKEAIGVADNGNNFNNNLDNWSKDQPLN